MVDATEIDEVKRCNQIFGSIGLGVVSKFGFGLKDNFFWVVSKGLWIDFSGLRIWSVFVQMVWIEML